MFEAAGASRCMAEVETLLREWRPERLVVGLPLAMDGSEHDMTRRERRFARPLEARFRLPVELAEQRLSSAAAEETFRETGLGARKRKHTLRALAAQIILQDSLAGPAPRSSADRRTRARAPRR